MASESMIQKKYGPLPLWGWVVVGVGAYELYKHFGASSNQAQSPVGTNQNTSGSTVLPTLPPSSIIPYSTTDQGLSGGFVSIPTLNDLGQFPGPSAGISPSTPTTNTPGAQSGPGIAPGLTPFTIPPVWAGGTLLDPTTQRPIFSGPNGEGGSAWTPGSAIPKGSSIFQMPDGRWASYVPGQSIQNGNRSALGLAPLNNATSLAPGASPLIAGQLTGTYSA